VVEAFPDLGVQGIEGLIIVVALFLLDGGGEGKKKEKKWGRTVSPGLDPLCLPCSRSQLLGAIKG
jgi:hypothetical protein